MCRALKFAILFVIGGAVYALCELMWRGYTYPAMAFVGGLCFILLGEINNWLSYDTPLLLQGLIGAGIITAIEFVSGFVLNILLGLNMWDYSQMPFNVLGQICLYFAGIWYVLSIGGIILDDFLRHWLFGEEEPHYKII
jgi:uncharacterized membrane protein